MFPFKMTRRLIDKGSIWPGLLAAFCAATAFPLSGCGQDGQMNWPLFADIDAGLTGVERCSLAWGDYDSDGDLDLVLAGNYPEYMSTVYVTMVYRNDAGAFSDIEAGLPGTNNCSLAWGDCDGDGDLDLALAGSLLGDSRIFLNEGSGVFTDAQAGLRNVILCSLAWGDYDNDGDLDLAVAGTGGTGKVSRIYRNDGAAAFTDITAGLIGVDKCSLAWGDYDSDGDLDLALAGRSDGGSVCKVYRNEGGTFVPIGAGQPGVACCSLAWGDYDSDGDLDLAVAGATAFDPYTTLSKVYRNDGGTFEDIGAGLTGVGYCSIAWGDHDNDGDLDIVLVGYAAYDTYASKVYRNDAGELVDIGAGLTKAANCSLAWGDYDNDGDLDLVLAGNAGNDQYVAKIYRNDAHASNSPPSAPCALASTVLGTDVILSWCPATDAETPAPGLSYNLRVRPESGPNDVMPGMADDATGYRRIPALGNAQKRCYWILKGLSPGTYHWSVQAIDAAYAGSPWAPEETVAVP